MLAIAGKLAHVGRAIATRNIEPDVEIVAHVVDSAQAGCETCEIAAEGGKEFSALALEAMTVEVTHVPAHTAREDKLAAQTATCCCKNAKVLQRVGGDKVFIAHVARALQHAIHTNIGVKTIPLGSGPAENRS